MLIRVEHETRYRFNRPVFLEPHLLRLAPRSDTGQTVESFSLTVNPAPSGRCDIVDASGSPATWLWFEGMTQELVIVSRSTVRTLRSNPFDYLLQPGAFSLPPALSPVVREALEPCLRTDMGRAVQQLTSDIVRETKGVPLSFLNALNDWLNRNIEVAPRPEPGIQTVRETLAGARGACRDVAVVFMAACRNVGIPARYVSGYQTGDAGHAEHDLHAWSEAYLPGAGWRGFDPTAGLWVAEHHVTLCAAHHPDLTTPVDGSFRGEAESTMDHVIALDILT